MYSKMSFNELWTYIKMQRSGDNDLAMEILDQRLKLETKREVDKAWIKTKSPEDLTVEILEKMKEEVKYNGKRNSKL